MSLLLWVCLLIFPLFGSVDYQDALFGSVIGVASGDRLNVRAKPNYKSKKVASLPNGAFVGIDRCKRVGKSIWCKVHHIAQLDYEGFDCDDNCGWVNAKYLKLIDKGYALINGKANCDYFIGCKNGFCTLVTNYKLDKDRNIVSIETKKVKRGSLYSQNHFGAMSPDGDGYCVNDRYIEEYLQKVSVKKPKSTLRGFLDSIEGGYSDDLYYYIHPNVGIKVSDKPYIGSQKAISRDKFLKYFEDNAKIIPKYYSGKDIKNSPKIGLVTFLKTLYRGEDKISKIDKKVISKNEVEYVVYHNLKDIYKYHGMVVRLKKINSRWYVVSIAHKQWGV
jgi:hypothetical protein